MRFSDFSDRFHPGSGILELMDDLSMTGGSDRKTFMLGGGNPAAIPLMEQCFREEMQAVLADENRFEQMIGNYDAPQGNKRFLRSLAELLSDEFKWPVTEHNIAVTNGSQSSFGILFNLFSGKFTDGTSKRILFPMSPEYIGYAETGVRNDIFEARTPIIDAESHGDSTFFKYMLDMETLNLDSTHGAVCISRPNNPTGNVITDQELSELCSATRSADIPLIIDGAYGPPFPSILFREATPVWNENIILCLSLSKIGLPGLRTGIVIADRELIQLIQGSNAINTLAPGRFGPTLVNRLITNRRILDLSRDVIQPHYFKRAKQTVSAIRELMRELPVRIHVPEGAIFLWLWFPGLPITSQDLYLRLKKRGVFVLAGHHFFPGLSGIWEHAQECIRISYSGDPEQVFGGLQIIAEEIRHAYG